MWLVRKRDSQRQSRTSVQARSFRVETERTLFFEFRDQFTALFFCGDDLVIMLNVLDRFLFNNLFVEQRSLDFLFAFFANDFCPRRRRGKRFSEQTFSQVVKFQFTEKFF